MAENQKLKANEYAAKALAGVGGGINIGLPFAITQLGLTGLSPLIRKVMKASPNIPENLKTETDEQLMNTAERLVRAAGIDPTNPAHPVTIYIEEKPGMAGVARQRATKKTLPKDQLQLSRNLSPELIAHEVGHITGNKSRLAKILNRLAGELRRPLPLAIAPALALSGALSSKEDVPTYAKAAPYLGTAQFASILGEEIRANIQAAKILKNVGYKLPLSQVLKAYLPTASYLGYGGLLVGTPLGILKGLQLYNESKKKGYPFTVKQMLLSSPQSVSKVLTPEEFKEKWKGRI